MLGYKLNSFCSKLTTTRGWVQCPAAEAVREDKLKGLNEGCRQKVVFHFAIKALVWFLADSLRGLGKNMRRKSVPLNLILKE